MHAQRTVHHSCICCASIMPLSLQEFLHTRPVPVPGLCTATVNKEGQFTVAMAITCACVAQQGAAVQPSTKNKYQRGAFLLNVLQYHQRYRGVHITPAEYTAYTINGTVVCTSLLLNVLHTPAECTAYTINGTVVCTSLLLNTLPRHSNMATSPRDQVRPLMKAAGRMQARVYLGHTNSTSALPCQLTINQSPKVSPTVSLLYYLMYIWHLNLNQT